MMVLRPRWNLTVFTSQLLLNKDVTEFRAAPITFTILLASPLAVHFSIFTQAFSSVSHKSLKFATTVSMQLHSNVLLLHSCFKRGYFVVDFFLAVSLLTNVSSHLYDWLITIIEGV